jgi:hypothetical protein
MIQTTNEGKDAVVAARVARVESMRVLQQSHEVLRRCRELLMKSLREFERCQQGGMSGERR